MGSQTNVYEQLPQRSQVTQAPVNSDEMHEPSPKEICICTHAFVKSYRESISKISTYAPDNPLR